MPSIAELFKKHGTDKITKGYGAYYDKHFPDEGFLGEILEIGVAQGYSIRAWLEKYPHATVWGIDVGERPFVDERFMFAQADQGLWKNVLDELDETMFNIIIDDGSHKTIHIIQTIAALWNSLVIGGLYVIEDLDSRRAKGARKLLKQMDKRNFDVLEFTDTLWIGRKCVS